MHEVAAEHGLEITAQLEGMEPANSLPTGSQTVSQQEEDQLSKR